MSRDKRGNGILEVDGSIPFSSTNKFTRCEGYGLGHAPPLPEVNIPRRCSSGSAPSLNP